MPIKNRLTQIVYIPNQQMEKRPDQQKKKPSTYQRLPT